MAIYALGDVEPRIDPEAYVHPDATVIGNVAIGAGSDQVTEFLEKSYKDNMSMEEGGALAMEHGPRRAISAVYDDHELDLVSGAGV